MENKDGFSYTYSAEMQREVENIRKKYLPNDEDKDAIQQMQMSFNMGANINAANYDIQKTMARGVEAAGQTGGANGLFGVGMGMNMMGGANIGNMTAQQVHYTAPEPVVSEWTCSCGTKNKGKFCSECGSPRR